MLRYILAREAAHDLVEIWRHLKNESSMVAFFAPALRLYFLFRVTGIPATEAQALRSKGDDYRRYRQTTSAFVPWFPRSDAERCRSTGGSTATCCPIG